MADRAIHFKIRLDPPIEVGLCVPRIRVASHVGCIFWERILEDSDMGVGSKLVVRSAARELMLSIHLRCLQPQHKSGRARMAEHAFITAGIVPDLLRVPLPAALDP